ncbi:hypothetical protein [Actinoplanes sp. NPDC051411]|uniref:hypothetical protein n=1 Tax=Actinoplanes sp. NPDC051411 TaxID=3155522 RepID=UPI003446B071
MEPEERREDAEEAAREWRDEERRKKYSGGWLSGGCADDAEPGVFVVFEDRPEGSTEPEAVRKGNVIWVDSGSGPGFSFPAPGA